MKIDNTKQMKYNIYFLIVGILLSSCLDSSQEKQGKSEKVKEIQEKKQKGNNSPTNHDQLREVENKSDTTYELSYFSGQAEISTFTLNKARYEGVHPGEAVLVFVAEPFLIDKQVKADHPTKENSVSVLKMNRIDRFSTGIYDYSLYTSVFTASKQFSAHYPLKITMGAQDWCGQTFTQINNNNGFEYSHHSYFESEGDTAMHFNYAMTGDNMFNLARISPDLLPTGGFEILPAVHYLRTSHCEIKTYNAKGSMTNVKGGKMYEYEIPALNRSVRITISDTNHHRITK